MCCDGNYAVPSIYYLNAQLKALWSNANECVNSTTADIKSSDYDKTKYFRALAQFHYFGQDKKARKRFNTVEELPFAACFDEPSVRLIGVRKLISLILACRSLLFASMKPSSLCELRRVTSGPS